MDKVKKGYVCSCGKQHNAGIEEYVAQKGAVNRVAAYAKKYGCTKAFVVADENTFDAAGEQVTGNLRQNSIAFSQYVLKGKAIKPDERTVGSVIMHCDSDCDLIIGIGSGVINDTCKILAGISGKPYIIVATAPSMDGYASDTSSMDVDGLKVSLPSRCANVIIGDTDILKKAPKRMLLSGLGDMLAKYVSICEWRISHIITGEYYCEEVAQMIRQALKSCVDHAEGLCNREDAAVQAVFEGLVLSGVAMNYAGLSRPAAGVEHHFSHIWDMRGLEFDTKTDLHGTQCAMGTYLAARLYEKLLETAPNREKASAYVKSFDVRKWNQQLKYFLGNGADAMIEMEKTDKKYDVSTHSQRFAAIESHWAEICDIICQEIPSSEKLGALLDNLGMDKNPGALGLDSAAVRLSFQATKDIRDKYILSRLAWDLGSLEELSQIL